MNYKIGVIGVGRIAEARSLPELTTIEGLEVSCIYDIDGKRLNHIRDKFNIPKAAASAEEFFNQPLDAVYVATPNSTHAEYAVKALEKDISVIIEKPCAHTLESAETILEAEKRSKAFALTAYMAKWNHNNKEVLELIGKNRIGELLTVTASFGGLQLFREEDKKEWRLYRKDAGPGALADLGIYIITTALDLFGEMPISCQAHGFPVGKNIFGEKFISGRVEFPGKRWLLIEASYINPTIKHCYTVLGKKGVIHVEDCWAQNGAGDITVCTEESVQKVFEREINPYREEFCCLKKCLDGNPVPSGMSMERALQDIKVMDALERSAAEMGKEIKII